MSKNYVAFATDANYAKYLEVALFQVSKHSPWRDVCILVDGTDELAEGLAQRAKEFGLTPLVIRVDDILNKRPRIAQRGRATRTTFARLFLADVLPAAVEKVLYLDLDILIRRDISPICDFNLELPLAAVGGRPPVRKELFGSFDTTYFNAGVLLIDVAKWRAIGALQKFEEILDSGRELKFLDQDLLNIVFQNNWQLLPTTSNASARLSQKYHTDLRYKDPLIVHFMGSKKPWVFGSGKYFKQWRKEAAAAGVTIQTSTSKVFKARVWYLIEAIGRKKWGKVLYSRISNTSKQSMKRKIK